VHVQIVLLQLLNVSIHIWLSHFHDNVGIRTWASYHLGLNTAGVFGEITDALLSVEVSITTADLQGALVATDVVVVAPLGRCHQESIGFAGAGNLDRNLGTGGRNTRPLGHFPKKAVDRIAADGIT